MGFWSEIRNDFFEGVGEHAQALEGPILATISIDAWKTADDWEEGKVIASVILSVHGDVLVDYRDEVARTDEAAQEAIRGAKEQLQEYFVDWQKKAAKGPPELLGDQDQEEHIVPPWEREENFEMNCPVYSKEGKFLYEAFFTCKSEWLQDYFDVDNRTQLATIWDIGDSWAAPENFVDAFRDANNSGFQINALARDSVKVEWEELGEGLHGDYDSMDPEDEELLRFSVFVLRDGVWAEKEDASYCTLFPVSATEEEKLAGLEALLERFYDVLSADIDASVKKLGEQMSWIDPASVSKHILTFNRPAPIQTTPAKANAAVNLIKAMVAYGLEHAWSDGEVINSLIQHGITYDDFCNAGAKDFVKGYLGPQIEKKPTLSDKIQSASTRAAETCSANKGPVKEAAPEHS